MSTKSTSEERPVLVVGAGPVGLTAAAELARRDVPVRLVDRAQGPSPLTKALMVWPRTLEIFRGLGAETYIDKHGLPVDSFRYYNAVRQICRIGFGEITKPSVIVQPDVEELLTLALEEAGGRIEWRTELADMEQDEYGVRARLRAPDGTETTNEFSYVIGCDGASSTVRKQLGLEYHGATYPNVFVLADTAIAGDLQRDAVHYYCTDAGIMVLIPLYNGRFRVFTAGPPGLEPDDLTEELLQTYVDERGPGGLTLHDFSWMTTFNIHARHTDQFRVGRAFIAGDAAHIHSPAGGQGLNTGVTDAHNLAWKLALVHQGQVVPALLDSYGTERSAVAAAVVKQAEVQTKAWMYKKRWQVLLRDNGARLAERLGLFDRYYSPWLAGLTNDYPGSIAVAEPKGGLRRGGFRNGHLFPDPALRASLPYDRYTLLVTGPAPDDLADGYSGFVTVRTAHRGKRFAAVLVRPDGYVAAQDNAAELPGIRQHLTALTSTPHRIGANR